MPLIFSPDHSRRDQFCAPFFSAFNALAIDNRGRRASVEALFLAAGHVKRFMNAHEGAIPVPQVEIVIDCGARRQILRDRPPLAASTQHVKQRIDDFPQVHPALVAAAFGRRDERSDKSPFLVRQITGIPQITAVIATAVLVGPHRPVPIESHHPIESQPIHLIQHVAGQALRLLA